MANYVENKEFSELLIDYSNTKNRKSYQTIGKIFQKITENIIRMPSFVNYPLSLKQDMVSDALYLMVRYLDRFDISRDNPFSYFTMICFNAYLLNIKRYYLHNDRYLSLDFIDNLDDIDECELISENKKIDIEPKEVLEAISKLNEMLGSDE